MNPGGQPIRGRLACVHLRVSDSERARRYFGELFGWAFTRAPDDGPAWCMTAAGIVDHPWALAITDTPSAPRVRLGFEVDDPSDAIGRARSLGGGGHTPEGATDDQGLPLAFGTEQQVPSTGIDASGELGVAVALVDDTARARAFYNALFGDNFGQIGRADRWWSDRAPFGVFSKALEDKTLAEGPVDVRIYVCVRDLAEHKARVFALGGTVVTESAMGPYQVCDCRDDQGTRFHLWCDPTR
jgi:predicted enzyme related to lactoylglutathione lyase